jgi:hypothetical protein
MASVQGREEAVMQQRDQVAALRARDPSRLSVARWLLRGTVHTLDSGKLDPATLGAWVQQIINLASHQLPGDRDRASLLRQRGVVQYRNPCIYRGCFRGLPYPCSPRAGLSSRARKAYGLFPTQLGATGGARSGR